MRFYVWYSQVSGAVEQAVAGENVNSADYATPSNTFLKEVTRQIYESYVMGHKHSYDVQNNIWVESLIISANDNKVVSDGVDVLPVTIQVGGAGHNETVNLYIDDVSAGQQEVVDGVCTVNLKSTLTGSHGLIVESTTIYGKCQFMFWGV